MEVDLQWDGVLGFEAMAGSGGKVITDASIKSGGRGRGPNPMELVLIGLGGCMGIDVVLILKKGRVELKEFSMTVEGNRREKDPRSFNRIKIKFFFQGRGLT